MIITRTPYRISFFGGGTDYPAWYMEHGGAVLATTIDKYCYLTCRFLPPFFEHKIRIVYSVIENCNSVDEIRHPSVREILKYLNVQRGVEIHHDGDLPARSGMGSSSAFTVGLMNAVHALHGRFAGKKKLALDSIELEQNILKETVGSQDQVMAAHGGFNHVVFHTSSEISVRPVILPKNRMSALSERLMLFYTGIKRTASHVACSYVDGFETKRRQLRMLKNMVDEALEVLSGDKDLNYFGELLHEAWIFKKSLGARVSNGEVDGIYDAARRAGALGGKITGAGGGGFLLLYVPIECQKDVKRALSGLLHVPFEFESSGSQVIYFDEEEDYSEAEKENEHRISMICREMDEMIPTEST
ncbi:MAG: kinase [Verrucomicrobia bacterium]|nr:kinase [Verrucomicrobiota bacterium]